MNINIVHLTVPEVVTVRDQILRVYLAAFSTPLSPEGMAEAERFTSSLSRDMMGEEFRCFIARRSSDMETLGFAYGCIGKPGQWWHDTVAKSLSHDLVERWMTNCFDLLALAVAPLAQGSGIGARLHDALLDGLPNRTAVLTTRRAETAAVRLYRKRGWITLTHDFLFNGRPEPYFVMGLDLLDRSSTSHGPAGGGQTDL